MFDNKRKFLFKCLDCEMIVSVDIEKEEDLEKIQKKKFFLECPQCDDKMAPLLD